MTIAVKPGGRLHGEALKEDLRAKLKAALPGTSFSFEAPDIISQVMSFGSPTPVEVAVQSPNLDLSRRFATKVYPEVAKLSDLPALHSAHPAIYLTFQI